MLCHSLTPEFLPVSDVNTGHHTNTHHIVIHHHVSYAQSMKLCLRISKPHARQLRPGNGQPKTGYWTPHGLWWTTPCSRQMPNPGTPGLHVYFPTYIAQWKSQEITKTIETKDRRGQVGLHAQSYLPQTPRFNSHQIQHRAIQHAA